MQSLPIEVYLTDSQGYRIDDVDFLQTLAVELEIVNQQNMGVEVEESAKASDIVSEQDSYTRELEAVQRFVPIGLCAGARHGLSSGAARIQCVFFAHLDDPATDRT